MTQKAKEVINDNICGNNTVLFGPYVLGYHIRTGGVIMVDLIIYLLAGAVLMFWAGILFTLSILGIKVSWELLR